MVVYGRATLSFIDVNSIRRREFVSSDWQIEESDNSQKYLDCNAKLLEYRLAIWSAKISFQNG